jgi:hypothetical protein
MAWLGVSEVMYYQSHPEMLQSRDSFPVVFAVLWAVDIMKPALGLAALLALYFLVAGPRAARYGSALLVTAWILTFALAWLFVTPTPFASVARLYWDAVPFVALSILPWLCAGVRLALRNATALAARHDGGT